MDILIRDLEMPTKGYRLILIHADGTVQSTDGETTAVPIPPHGRLGDLNELARKIEHDRYNHTHTYGLAARHHVAEYGHFLKAISDAPIIIPAESITAEEEKNDK